MYKYATLARPKNVLKFSSNSKWKFLYQSKVTKLAIFKDKWLLFLKRKPIFYERGRVYKC